MLIIIYWPDAKAGTVANVLIALVLGLVYAHDRFEAQADQEVRQLLMPLTAYKSVVTQEMLIQLPMPVQQWLITSSVVGKELIHTVRLQQRD